MANFFTTGGYKYVMLPLQEEPFVIDLNSRNIIVPNAFKLCAGVQSDQIAEMIIFEVDRYFDYMDLATTSIYVQWTTPEDRKNGIESVESATRVEMIDLESAPGKIRFAWPLNDQITKYPGTVKFSIRFFRQDDNQPDTLLYSLNTIENSIVIKPALQPNLNRPSNVEKPITNGLFAKAIENSHYSGDGVIPPKSPSFGAPGSEIESSSGITVIDKINMTSLVNDTLTLRAQAFVMDSGNISYKWYHSKNANGPYYNCEYYPVEFNEKGEAIAYETFGTVADDFVLLDPQPEKGVEYERYYINDGNGFKLYSGTIPTQEHEIYVRYSTFTVPVSGNVTGYYLCKAWNSIPVQGRYVRYHGELSQEDFEKNITFYKKTKEGYVEATIYDADEIYYVDKVLTTHEGVCSNECLLPGPEEVIFKVNGNLSQGAILTAVKDEDDVVIGHTATLKVETEKDKYNSPTVYEWRKSKVSLEDALNDETPIIENESDNELSVSDIGWYSAKAISSLNREDAKKYSNVCKVTHLPEPPTVTLQDTSLYILQNKGDASVRTVTLSIDASMMDESHNENLLFSEGLEYIWEINPSNTEDYKPIKDNAAGISGLHTNSITIDYDFDMLSQMTPAAANFRCIVVNKLNGFKAIFNHSGQVNNFKDSDGIFKNEPPYVYEDNKGFVFTVMKT